MRLRIRWVGLLLVLLTLLSGCGAEPATPEAAARAARAFMEARAAGNGAAVGAMLTAQAQKAISQSQISRFLREADASFADLGSPTAVEPGVVRIPVRDLTLAEAERTVRWPESWLTLRYEGGRWRVAWAEPLFYEAMQAYLNGLYNIDLGHTIVAIDPYHYRGHLELHFAYRGLKRYRMAEVAINAAMERATAAERPAVHDAMARFKLAINAPADALAHARQALALAAPLIPELYSVRWQADTLVVAGRAALALNDRASAEAFADQAAAIDPENADLAIFRHQLATLAGAKAPPGP